MLVSLPYTVNSRDVTKSKFGFNNVRTLNVFNRFEIRRMF